MLRYFSLLLVFFSLTSCITTKDIDLFSSKKDITYSSFKYAKKLQKGDLISVIIHTSTPSEYDLFNKKVNNSQFYNPYLDGYTINDSGFVSLPLIGEVYLEGKTFMQAEKDIADLSSKFLQNPSVKVNQLNFEINVLGEVASPGKFLVQNKKLNILDAISLAGGFNMEANRKKIKIIRFNEGKSLINYLDLSDPSVSKNPNFYLETNDIVFVLPVKKRFIVLNNLSSAISILLSTISLYILISQTNN